MDMDAVDNYHEAWAKCPFCGKYNGQFGRPLEQHSSRCVYKGDANSRDVMIPNHSKFIEEDDVIFLPMMWALRDLPMTKKKLERSQVENAVLRSKLAELGALHQEDHSLCLENKETLEYVIKQNDKTIQGWIHQKN